MDKLTFKGSSMVREIDDGKDSNPWVRLGLYVCRDTRLTSTSIGVLIRILSHNQVKGAFTILKYVEQRNSGLGLKTFNKAWKGLEDCKYIVKSRNKQGGTHWYIDPNPENITNWKVINKEKEEFISYGN